MKYMLLIYNDEAKIKAMPKDEPNKMLPAYAAYTEAMKKAGVWTGGERLRFTDSSTTIRVQDGKTKVLNGPYVEAKEQLAGFYLIEVPDLDNALSWAARCPGASNGTVELRPVWDMH